MFNINTDIDNLLKDKLQGHFPEAVSGHEMIADMHCLTVEKEAVPAVMRFLRDDPDLEYNFLTTLCGIHDPGQARLGVVYHLHSLASNHRIRIRTFTPESTPVIPTITDIWPAANWMERETYDFFGIIFEGHPNLRRILNVDDMEGFPLRKDFPLEDPTRDDKNDGMFGR